MTSSITENNLSAFKKYLDNKDSDINRYIGSAGIQYSYDTRFSVFSHDPDGTLVNADVCRLVHLYVDAREHAHG